MTDLTLVTYGGGEILYNVFNGIAMLFHGKDGGIVRPLAIMAASIGGIIALSKAFFSPPEGFITKYLLPLLALPCLLLTMTTTIRIEDVVQDKSYQVIHVPYALGKFAELISSIGYQATVSIEKVMHVPNDQSYNQTGMIFGGDTSLNIHRYAIKNGDLLKNLKRFSRQCVLYDIALGKYSIDQLKKTTDLWGFLKSHTSNVRMINYVDPSAKTDSETFLTCKQALEKMTPLFEEEKGYYAQDDIIKNLPLTFQSLTGLQRSQEDLISQQLMMNVLSNEYSGSSFATARAQAQQKSTYLVLGSLASSSLITMRAVLEVLIYTSFIFIVPLAFLPGGFKFLSTWVWLVIWIQLWPPFYAILNYVMQIVARSKSAGIFYGLSEADKGLSFFTSIGINNLNEDIFALSGYLAASIPFISYALIQGGVNSFVHLAGSMMTPAHSAATSAAGELVSGNYSLANSSFGQMSYQNSTLMQKNLAPSVSSGYFTENSGNQSLIHSPSETIVNQANSNFRTSLFSDDSISKSLQNSYQHAETSLQSKQDSFTESLSNHTRQMVDVTEHLGSSTNYSEGFSNREAYDAQESARYLMSTAENFAQSHNISVREGLQALVGVSTGGLGKLLPININGSIDRTSSQDDLYNAALNIAKSEDFQNSLQKITDYSFSSSSSSLNDEGQRLVQGFTKSIDQVATSQEQYQNALNTMNQISENLAWTNNTAQSLKHSLNQDFMNWATEKFLYEGGQSRAQEIITGNDHAARDSLINEFISSQRCSSGFESSSFADPNQSYGNSHTQKLDAGQMMGSLNNFASQNVSQYLSKEDIFSTSTNLHDGLEQAKNTFSTARHDSHNRILDNTLGSKANFIEKTQQWGLSKIWDGPQKNVDLINKYQLREKPFWVGVEE